MLLYNQTPTRTTSFRDVRVRNSNQEIMSSSIEPRVLVSICETNLNDQFEPSFRDNRDRNSQQETTSLPTRWNKTKKQNRDASRVVCKTFREDMSYPASARNIPNNNVRLPRASWQDDDINITCHQTHTPIQPRHSSGGHGASAVARSSLSGSAAEAHALHIGTDLPDHH